MRAAAESALAEVQASPAQLSTWRQMSRTKRPGSFHMSRCWRLRGQVDGGALADAVSDVVAAHDALRSTFWPDGDQLIRRVHNQLPPDFLTIGAASLADCSELVRSELSRPIDVTADSPVRCRLIGLGEDHHVLLVVVHHIVFDAWSADVFLRQVDQHYRRRSGQLPAELAPDTLSRANQAATSVPDGVSGPDGGGTGFWRRQFETPPDDIVAGRYGAPDIRSGDGVVMETTLGASLGQELDRLARENRATPFVLYLTALRVALWRWSGRTDLVVYTSAVQRPDETSQDEIGLLVRAVPLRCPVAPGMPFVTALSEQRRNLLDSFDNLDVGWDGEDLVAANGEPPAVSIGMAIRTEDSPVEVFIGGLPARPVAHGVDCCHADLVLEVVRSQRGVRLLWTFDADSFAAATVRQLATAFPGLLTDIAADPGQPCSELGMPVRPTVMELMESAVQNFPARSAVVGVDETLSYAEFFARARRVAVALTAWRVRSEYPVAVLMNRSPQQIAVLVGIMLAGAPYLCLDEGAPSARLAALVRQSRAQLVIADADLADMAGRTTAPVLELSQVLAITGPLPARGPTGLDLAYLLYTSGSTGEPKGVPVRHDSLAAYCTAIAAMVADQPAGFRYASVTSLSTDLGNTAVFGALTSGGCLHLVDPSVYCDPFAFAEYMREHRIDVLKITPSHLSALLDAGDPQVLPTKVLIVGGEKLPWSLADSVFAASSCRVINHYGPTEATIGCLAYEVQPDDPLRHSTASVPVGRPLADAEVRLVGWDGHAPDPGTPGELEIAGIPVCHGYWYRPDLTAQRFYSDQRGVRWYRTGDQAREMPGGLFEYLARQDDQVKIRGHRVEPAEVQAALVAHPGVRQAVVLPAVKGAPRLLAFVVPHPQFLLNAAQLRSHVATILPDYLVPAVVKILERFPLGPNGKVDRQLLLREASAL